MLPRPHWAPESDGSLQGPGAKAWDCLLVPTPAYGCVPAPSPGPVLLRCMHTSIYKVQSEQRLTRKTEVSEPHLEPGQPLASLSWWTPPWPWGLLRGSRHPGSFGWNELREGGCGGVPCPMYTCEPGTAWSQELPPQGSWDWLPGAGPQAQKSRTESTNSKPSGNCDPRVTF